MIVAFISIALLSQVGSPSLMMPVGDRVPVINIEKNCKATAAADEAMKLNLAQSVENCTREENAAREQLAAIWSRYSASVRDRCTTSATVVGVASYVELLTCVQMTDPTTLAPTTDLKGAGKSRDKN